MREHLIAFIKAIYQRWEDTNEAPPMLSLGSPHEGELRITFGRQYANPGTLIVWRKDGDVTADVSVEDGVDEFLKFYGLE